MRCCHEYYLIIVPCINSPGSSIQLRATATVFQIFCIVPGVVHGHAVNISGSDTSVSYNDRKRDRKTGRFVSTKRKKNAAKTSRKRVQRRDQESRDEVQHKKVVPGASGRSQMAQRQNSSGGSQGSRRSS